MTNSDTRGSTGIDLILEYLMSHYEVDPRDRLQGVRRDGGLPRFVIARSAEGCVWRFRFDLDEEITRRIAKLAGRERGWGRFEGQLPAPPERLVMMARMLGQDTGDRDRAPRAEREEILRAGRLMAEIWTFE